MRILSIIMIVVALVALAGCIMEPPQAGGNETLENTTAEPPAQPEGKPVETAPETEEPVEEKAEEKTEEPIEEEVQESSQYDPELPRKEAKEGELVNFPNLKAVDPDGDPITYTFTSPLDENGEWQTDIGDAGEYLITITASDGTNTASQELVLVVRPANIAPEISIANRLTFKEGETVILEPEVSDEDGDTVEVMYFGWMNSNTKETGYKDQGEYKVTIQADDGKEKIKKDVTIIIENVNRKPEFEKLAPIEIKEGEEIEARVKVMDPDGDPVTISFAEPLDQNGNWRTEVGDAGEYSVTVTANDGKTEVKEQLLITVEALNKAPLIQIVDRIEIEEGETVRLEPTVEDPEGEEFTVKYSGWMTGPVYETTYEDSGTHTVVITAEDSGGRVNTKEVTIVVEDVNRAPVFDAGSFI